MTDKVQKIRDEIEKIKVIIQSYRVKSDFSEGYFIGQESLLRHFEKFVDSMQEEPTTSVWHDAKEMPPDDIIVFRYIDGLTTCRYVGQTMKDVVAWAYFKDLKKL